MSYTTLLFEVLDGIALATITRADKANALTDTVINELGHLARRFRDDSALNALILTGAGPKAFAAGADIGELAGCDPAKAEALSRKGTRIFREFELSPKPVIAAVNGLALGGGCELAMACHVRIASENARFGQPEVLLGICPGYGGTVRLPRLVGRGRAVEMLTTGMTVDAAEAHRIGLVNRVVPQAELMQAARALAATMILPAPLAVAACLRLVDSQDALDLDAALLAETVAFAGLAGSEDFREGTGAFLAKRKAAFQGR